MVVAGIIAEYNPLHNGHLYQIEKIRAELKPDYIIVILGNNFSQRGGVSILDKFDKTKIALELGVSLVIELPTIFSCSSAEYFADASVKLLNSLNVVTHLCFGTESENLIELKKIAEILTHEDKRFKAILKDELESGISYPKARNNTLLRYIGKSISDSYANQLLNSPNNILAIEYLKSLIRTRSKIIPYLTKRIGPGENSDEIDDNISSASNIRNILLDEKSSYESNLKRIKKLVPKEVFSVLKESNPICIDSYSDLLLYNIRSNPEEYFEDINEVREGNQTSIINASKEFNNISDITIESKSKRFTYTSISRTILNMLLNIKKDDFTFALKNFPRYVRVLGFREDAQELIRMIEKKCKKKLIINFNKFYKECNDKNIKKLLDNEMKYNNIYNIKKNNNAFSDLTQKVINYK